MADMIMKPTEEISVRDVFGIDTDMKVKGFAEATDRVPAIDPTYKFDPDTTLAILAGYAWDENNPFVSEPKRRLRMLSDICATESP